MHSNGNITDYIPSATVRSLINSTISGNEYWHSNQNGQRLHSNLSETYNNELIEPETTLAIPNKNGNTKIIRKIKRTFKTLITKQHDHDKQSAVAAAAAAEESANEWKEENNNNNNVEPSIILENNHQLFMTTTSSPIQLLSKSSTTTNLVHSTAAATELDNLITSKVKWDDTVHDDSNNELPLSRSPIFKTKIGNQESIYEKYANIMPLPPPSTQQSTTIASTIDENANSNSNNQQQSSSHHSIVAPLSSSNNNNYFNFNSKIVHTQPAAARSSSDKNPQRGKKQNKQMRNLSGSSNQKHQPIQDFFLETEKIDNKKDEKHLNLKHKTVDFTSRVNHEIRPSNNNQNILAHLLKNNPFAIPISKKTYKVTRKATTPTTFENKRIANSLNVKYASPSVKASDEYTGTTTTTPLPTLSNDNLDQINFKAKSSTQDYTWGRRVQASSNNLISKTNSKSNLKLSQQLLAKRNEWSGNDEQKDSINDKLLDNNESDEESVENEGEKDTNEDTELINNEDLNNEFNKNIAAIRNEEPPNIDVVTFKTTNNKGINNQNQNQLKGSLNVKSLPIQIISWRQAINHRKKESGSNDDRIASSTKPFAGERITSAKLTVSNRPIRQKEQQIERERPKAFSNKQQQQTTKQPFSSTSGNSKTTVANNNSFRTTIAPKLTTSGITSTTTKSAYQNSQNTIAQNSGGSGGAGKTTRNALNSFVANRKNEAYIAPSSTTKTKPAQLFQEYEDEKDSFREELEDNFINRQQQADHTSPKKENRVKYAKNQEFRKKSLNLIEADKNGDNSVENDQTGILFLKLVLKFKI